MREKDKEYVESCAWVVLWAILCAFLLVTSKNVLTFHSDEDTSEARFPCPWMTVFFTFVPALGILYPAGRLQMFKTKEEAADAIQENEEAKKKTQIMTAVLAVLQACECGFSGLAQTGMTMAMREEASMLTPIIVVAINIYIGTEAYKKELIAAAVGATLGGLLVVRGDLGISNLEMPVVALVARLVAILKWMLARVWLMSANPKKPTIRQLAFRMLAGGGILAIELNWLFQYECFGKCWSLPWTVWGAFLAMAVAVPLWLLIELRLLELTSVTLLGFAQPFYSVLLVLQAIVSSGTVGIMHYGGLLLFGASMGAYVLLRMKEHRSETQEENCHYLELKEVSKTVLVRGDGATFPKRGDDVRVKYVGTLASTGVTFDMGDLTFKIGTRSVIDGWDVGVMRMSLGEQAVLHVPAEYGYGRRGHAPRIPPNADLVFQVQLLKINDKEAPLLSTCVQM
eukprot:TRINITY_DN63347_c0_g1_i1.p1 TRINITY_DN63347_c0_g1~~TRINITY_DN63347_c0_g1_i1.p1  ORF type:complete len:455 (-),score=117.81 TRINITY_DN63347_c0_g1_i1:100-1464(-)